MKIIEIVAYGYIMIDYDNTLFLTSEVAVIDGKTKATVDAVGSIEQLTKPFHPLTVVWLN